ncbi:hypothetical protein FQZ97_828090 [compost metagenome]
MAVLTADWALPRWRAAAENEPHSAVVTNWRNWSTVHSISATYSSIYQMDFIFIHSF